MGKKQTLIKILIFGMLLAVSLLLSSVASVRAQGAGPTATGTPDVVSTLQAVVTTQHAEANQQKIDTDNKITKLELAVGTAEWKWGLAGLIVGAVGSILVTLGIRSLTDFNERVEGNRKKFDEQFKEMEKRWESELQESERKWIIKSQKSLNKILDKFELNNLPIFVPKELGALRLRLEYSALTPKEYENLEQVPLKGVIVVKIDTPDEQMRFRSFIEKYKPNPQRTAFLLYAAPNSLSTETLACYDNLVTSNFPSTAVTHILAIGRGLQTDNEDDK